MPLFAIHTEEVVHGIYHVEATTAEEARNLFLSGWTGTPELYEATDMDVERVELVE